MAVLIEAFSVVVPVDVLDVRYPGGLDAFESDCPNQTFCCDGHVARVGFMAPADVETFVRALEQKGLKPFDGDHWGEVAVVDQHSMSTTAPCDWLEEGRKFDGPAFVRLKKDQEIPIDIYLPAGWKYEGSLTQRSGYAPIGQMDDRYEFLRSEDSIDVYMDRQVGEEVFVARATPPTVSDGDSS